MYTLICQTSTSGYQGVRCPGNVKCNLVSNLLIDVIETTGYKLNLKWVFS